jgi:hypothetical protein
MLSVQCQFARCIEWVPVKLHFEISLTHTFTSCNSLLAAVNVCSECAWLLWFCQCSICCAVLFSWHVCTRIEFEFCNKEGIRNVHVLDNIRTRALYRILYVLCNMQLLYAQHVFVVHHWGNWFKFVCSCAAYNLANCTYNHKWQFVILWCFSYMFRMLWAMFR